MNNKMKNRFVFTGASDEYLRDTSTGELYNLSKIGLESFIETINKICNEYEYFKKESYLKICEKDCGKLMTVEDIINCKDCNFCDLPYIFLDNQIR